MTCWGPLLDIYICIARCGKGDFVLPVEDGIIGHSIFYAVIEWWVEYSRLLFHDAIMCLSVV